MDNFRKHIVVADSIRLPIGMVVGLTTDAQLRKRLAKLEPTGVDGFYAVIKHVGFKKGEEILLDPSAKFNPKQVAEIRQEIPEEEGGSDKTTTKPEGDVLIKAIRDAIFSLGDEDYTNDELPKVDALSSRLDYIISAEERNEGFAAHTEYVEQLRQSVEMLAAKLKEDEIPTANAVAEFFKDETITQELVNAIYATLKKGEENE